MDSHCHRRETLGGQPCPAGTFPNPELSFPMARRLSPIRLAFLAALVVVSISCPSAGADIAVSEMRWGFDGTVREFAFVPVSFLVRNDSQSLQTIRLRLGRCEFPPNFEGDLYEQEVTLGPASSRWVQFLPCVHSTVQQWHLQYGPDAADFYPLPQPRSGRMISVLLDSPARRPSPTPIDRLPAELFPVSVSATDTLDLVFLDHVPEWDGVRIQAFREWLSRGGKLALLWNDDGEFPEFSNELADLNDAAGEFPIGSGQVQRVPRRARDVTSAEVRSLARLQSTSSTPAAPSGTQGVPPGTVVPKSGFFLEALVETLGGFRRPWWLIYPIAILYLVIIGPACFLLARHRSLREFYTVFVSATVVAAVLFIVVNSASVGSRSRLRSVAVARKVTERVWDVRRWTALANVQSGTYQVEGRGSGSTYGTFSGDGPAVVESGSYRLTRPTMSNFTFQMKERLEVDELWITVLGKSDSSGGTLGFQDVLVQLHGPLQELKDKTAVGYLLAGDQLQPFKVRQGRIEMEVGTLPIHQALFDYQWTRVAYQRAADWFPPTETEIYLSLLKPMVRHLLSDPVTGNPLSRVDGYRLFLLAPLPEEMAIQGDFPDQAGYVLYVVDW